MNKAKFLEIINSAYTAEAIKNIRISSFTESEEEYTRLKTLEPKYPWVRFATIVVINENYHITLSKHRSKEAMLKLVIAATKWAEEYNSSLLK